MFGISRKGWRVALLAVASAGVLPMAAHAQFSQAPQVPKNMIDSPTLKPPAGSNVAIVEFYDLECPACRAANPIVKAAAAKYHVAWMRHDFPLQQHIWSFDAAVNAKWLDTKSKTLGNDYRDYIFDQQPNIATKDDLNQLTQKWASQHSIQMPFAVDPQGKFADAIRADRDLGRSLNVNQTPTIWVVTANSHDPGYPIVQVTDPQLLYSYLDQAISATSGASSKPAAHKTAHKAS